MGEEKWTTATLKEYFDFKIDSYWKKTELRFGAMDKAMELFQSNLQNKLEQMNEWRGQSKDMVQTMMPRAEQCIINDNVTKELRALRETGSEQKGEKTGKKDFTATIIASVSFIGMIVAIVFSLSKCFIGG